MSPLRLIPFLLLSALALLASACSLPAPEAASAEAPETLAFDVSEDMNRFLFAEAPVFEDGMPSYGNPFITEGYLYPAGTLDGNVSGVNADGSPTWPDEVVGTWTCRGYLVGEGAHATEGDMVISTQVLRLGDDEAPILVTEGFERADDVLVSRAITGGTGPHAGARGEATQRMLGLNESEGVQLQVELRIAP